MLGSVRLFPSEKVFPNISVSPYTPSVPSRNVFPLTVSMPVTVSSTGGGACPSSDREPIKIAAKVMTAQSGGDIEKPWRRF